MTHTRPLQQRVLILQVLRSWCAETDKLQFLFETYDMRPVRTYSGSKYFTVTVGYESSVAMASSLIVGLQAEGSRAVIGVLHGNP